jgi:hypothetical protein
MPTPSLILVPARFKTGKLYTPVATTSGGLVLGASGDFNVTRATIATRVNASGLIEVVASGIPRLDYFASGGVAGCPALLVEPSAQNIMAQSETLSVSGNWSRTNVLVSGGVIASPNGLASGTLIVATSGNTQHSINRQASSVTSGAVVTVSCFFKAHGTNNFAQLVIGGFEFSPASPFANFNLSGNGAITTGTYSSAFIQNYGNGWYRCGLTTTAAANGSPTCLINPILASGTARDSSFTGDGVNGVYAWGFQVEAGSVATSYIPTTTGSVTRNVDQITVSDAVSGVIGQTEGTIYAEVDMRVIPQFIVPIAIDVGTVNEYLILAANSDGAFRVVIKKSTGSQTQLIISSSNPVGVYKLALAYKNGDYALSINGATPLTSSDSTNYPTGTFSRVHLSFQAYGVGLCRTRAAALYPTRLTNAELQSLTTL